MTKKVCTSVTISINLKLLNKAAEVNLDQIGNIPLKFQTAFETLKKYPPRACTPPLAICSVLNSEYFLYSSKFERKSVSNLSNTLSKFSLKCTAKEFAIQCPSPGVFFRLGVSSGSNLHRFVGMSVTIIHESLYL